ncbi:MAG TPA: hypothetical protein VGD99_02170 [Anaerolineae bacterium]|jgi:hypothetical protein
MNIISSGQILSEKLANLVDRLAESRRQITSTQNVDELYAEIRQREKLLANAPTRPTRVRKPQPLEPITEQQKIMDFAG